MHFWWYVSASNGSNIAWDNLEYDQPFVDNGRCGKVQDNKQPLECGLSCGELERSSSSSYTQISSRNIGTMMRRVISCAQC